MTRPVIAIAGLAIETSTFSPARTDVAGFRPRRGAEAIDLYPFLSTGTELAEAAEWHGVLIGRALPGGTVLRTAYESLADEMVAGLKALSRKVERLDGIWFDIHGAMVVEGLEDAEADLLERVRRVVGREILVSASMDLHGNVSRRLVAMLDLVTCYRMAPHEDELETKERACRNLVACISREKPQQRPIKAWIPVPILLPGEQTSTRDEPARSIYASVAKVAELPGVLDAAVWVGYAWADEPRNRAAVVVTGWSEEAVAAGAERLARLFWAVRADFHFVAPTGSLDECLEAALAAPMEHRPFFVSDSGDNPTAGGAGDVTWGLRQLLRRPEWTAAPTSAPAANVSTVKTVIYASLPGKDAVHKAVAAGVGSTITVTAGAEIDNLHSGPVTLTGRVHALRHGDRNAGIEAVLQVEATPVYVILTERRKPYHFEHDFTALALQPRKADVVVVKIGYLEPELYDMAKGWMLALTPGGVDQDLLRLGHRRLCHPIWPFDRDFDAAGDLTARIVGRE